MNSLITMMKQNRNFRIILSANFINRIGDSAETLAYTFLLYQLTGSASISAFGLVINLFPTVFLQPFLGPVVEKLDKKKTMIISDIIRSLLVISIPLLMYTGYFHYRLLLLVNFLVSVAECFRVPAGVSVIPLICNEEEYAAQASMSSLITTISTIIGSVVAGVLLESVKTEIIFVLYAVAYFISALLLMKLKIRSEISHDESPEEPYLFMLKKGFSDFIGNRHLRLLSALVIINNMLTAPLSAMEAPILNGLLDGGADLLTIVSVSGTIAVIAGSVVFTPLLNKMKPAFIIVPAIVSYAALYGGILLISNVADHRLLYILMALLHFLCTLLTIWLSLIINVLFMQSAHKETLARSAAMFNAAGTLALPVFSALLAVIVRFIQIPALLSAFAVLSVVFAATLAPVIRHADMEITPPQTKSADPPC